jgi:hypothetical protein
MAEVELDNAPIDFVIGPRCFNSAAIVTGDIASLEVRPCHGCLTASQFAATIAVSAGRRLN